MSVLVLAEISANSIAQSTRSAAAAGAKLGDVHVLVAGQNCSAAAEAAAKFPGIAKVLQADAPPYAHGLAEPMELLLSSLAPNYSHILAAATASGKNFLPRAAALLDVQILSDVTAIVDAEALVQTLGKSAAVALRQNRSYAVRTAFQISGAVLLSVRSLPRLN
jgi:electron transfer flavoprotein alpha subunit